MMAEGLRDREGEVIETACEVMSRTGRCLCRLGYGSEVLVGLLGVVHSGESQQGKLMGIHLLCELAPAFGPELTRRFIVNELLSIADDLSTAYKEEIALHYRWLWDQVDIHSFKVKLMPMFARLVGYSDGLVRQATIDAFAPGLEAAQKLGILAEVTEEFTRWYHSLLQDKSRSVQHYSYLSLPLVLCALHSPSPLLMSIFLESFSKTSAKDYIQTCANCLPTLIELYGRKEWTSLRLVYMKTLTKAEGDGTKIFAEKIWKVAEALGPEITDRDLVPVFNELHKTKSLRMLLISNLSRWIKALPEDERESLISYLQALAISKDWRERALLGRELGNILPIFPSFYWEPLLRLSLSLSMDRCDQTSAQSCFGLSAVLTYLLSSSSDAAATGMDLVKAWAGGRTWSIRRRFLRVVKGLDLRKPGMEELKEEVKRLGKDSVANVRVLVAEIAAQYEDLAEIRNEFRKEKDVDVSRTIALLYDEKVNRSQVLLPATVHTPAAVRESESRLEFLVENRSESAALLSMEAALDEFGFPVTD